MAPTIGLFIVARAASGTANAFLTPLLLAGLAEVTERERLGRAVGTFAAVQTAAIALAPAVGGVLGEIDWRLAFLAPAAVAIALAFVPPPDAQRLAGAEPARLRAVFTHRVGLLSAAAFAGYAGVTSLGFLVALRCSDAFGLGSSARGAVLAGFGVAGMVSGRPSGRLVDRLGRISVTVAGAFICAVLVGLIGAAGSVTTLALLWLAAGAASSLIWAGLNTLTIEAVPANRAGATSVVSAFKFAGNAAAPAMWLPLYARDVRLAFLAAGAAVGAGGCGRPAPALTRFPAHAHHHRHRRTQGQGRRGARRQRVARGHPGGDRRLRRRHRRPPVDPRRPRARGAVPVRLDHRPRPATRSASARASPTRPTRSRASPSA